jgi:hypothetical protein
MVTNAPTAEILFLSMWYFITVKYVIINSVLIIHMDHKAIRVLHQTLVKVILGMTIDTSGSTQEE